VTPPSLERLTAVVLMNKAVGPTAEVLAITKPLATEAPIEVLNRLCLHWDIRESRKAA
jgi:hypothetical protein